MPLEAGRKLGPYEIVEPIGKGGMGEVYRARDTKLDRDVAIKVLPEEFASDDERLARFEREAKLLASLNHPNIASIYGLEESDGVKALVLELVEGQTLAERIERGPIPVDEAIASAKQIAEALEAGHEAGVIHRDLKPANIKLKEDGTVKVLDYGLAKALEGDAPASTDSELSQSPTLTRQGTQIGMILGTAAYMSPEQAKGKKVDKRADVWAFGAVLYEMLTGKRAYVGEDVSDTLAAVLRAEPEWDKLPADLSPTFLTYLTRCLEKDPKQRVRDIGDVRLAMEGAFETEAAPAELISNQRGWRPSVVLAVGFAVAGTALALWMLRPRAPFEIVRLTIMPSIDEPLRLVPSDPSIAITPDGRQVAYNTGATSTGGISLRPLDQLHGARLTELPLNVDSPFASPDSLWLGFDDGGARLGRVALSGGLPQTICRLDGALRGASWGADGTIVFATQARNSGLFRVDATGGEPQPLTTPADGEGDHFWPDILPGGRQVLFTIVPDGPIADARIAVLDVATGEHKVLIQGGSGPRYVPTGHIVYGESGRLRAVNFDTDRLEVRGNPRLVVDGVGTESNGAVHFGLADNGSLVYITDADDTSRRGGLVWVSRDGRDESPLTSPDLEQPGSLRVSPNGQHVALLVAEDVWVYDVTGRPPIRITTGGVDIFSNPLWTRDGQRILYTVFDAVRSVFSLPSDGSGGEPQTVSPEGRFFPFGWSATGEDLVALHSDGPQRHIVKWSLAEPEKVEPVVQTAAFEGDLGVAVSPDGRWLAYTSNRDGEQEIWVQAFPGPGAPRRVSPSGGIWPTWARDGRELYYVEGTRLMAVAVDTEGGFSFSQPTMLFDVRAPLAPWPYDVAGDGRFLMIKWQEDESPREPRQIVLIQNFYDELDRLVP